MDLYAVAIEFLVNASSMQDARQKIEALLRDNLHVLMGPNDPIKWECRRLRGVTAPHVKEIEMRPSPPFRGKFIDEPNTEAKLKALERITNELREEGILHDATKKKD